MAFPLTGNLLSGAVRVIESPLITVRYAPTGRTWSLRHTQHLFPTTQRSALVGVRSSDDTKIISGEMVRRWNGVGGIQYVPSFPQLILKETSFPLGR